MKFVSLDVLSDLKLDTNCAPPTEGIGISCWGGGGFCKAKTFKEMYEAYLEYFQRGGGSLKKSLPWGRYGYFLELHIGIKVCCEAQCFKFYGILCLNLMNHSS